MRVLQGEFGEGDRVVVDASGAELHFTRQQTRRRLTRRSEEFSWPDRLSRPLQRPGRRPQVRMPPDPCCGTRSAFSSSSRSPRGFTWSPGRAGRFRTASSSRSSGPARSRRSRRGRAGARNPQGVGGRVELHGRPHRRPEAHRGSRAARREVHRRGVLRLDDGADGMGIAHPAARGRLEFLPQAHGRRGGRRHVVRPQPREDLLGR